MSEVNENEEYENEGESDDDEYDVCDDEGTPGTIFVNDPFSYPEQKVIPFIEITKKVHNESFKLEIQKKIFLSEKIGILTDKTGNLYYVRLDDHCDGKRLVGVISGAHRFPVCTILKISDEEFLSMDTNGHLNVWDIVEGSNLYYVKIGLDRTSTMVRLSPEKDLYCVAGCKEKGDVKSLILFFRINTENEIKLELAHETFINSWRGTSFNFRYRSPQNLELIKVDEKWYKLIMGSINNISMMDLFLNEEGTKFHFFKGSVRFSKMKKTISVKNEGEKEKDEKEKEEIEFIAMDYKERLHTFSMRITDIGNKKGISIQRSNNLMSRDLIRTSSNSFICIHYSRGRRNELFLLKFTFNGKENDPEITKIKFSKHKISTISSITFIKGEEVMVSLLGGKVFVINMKDNHLVEEFEVFKGGIINRIEKINDGKFVVMVEKDFRTNVTIVDYVTKKSFVIEELNKFNFNNVIDRSSLSYIKFDNIFILNREKQKNLGFSSVEMIIDDLKMEEQKEMSILIHFNDIKLRMYKSLFILLKSTSLNEGGDVPGEIFVDSNLNLSQNEIFDVIFGLKDVDLVAKFINFFSFFKRMNFISHLYVLCLKIQQIEDVNLLLSFLVKTMKCYGEEELIESKEKFVENFSLLSVVIINSIFMKVENFKKGELLTIVNDRIKKEFDKEFPQKVLTDVEQEFGKVLVFLDMVPFKDQEYVKNFEFHEVFDFYLGKIYSLEKFKNLELTSSLRKEVVKTIKVHKFVLLLKSNFFRQMIHFSGEEIGEGGNIRVTSLNFTELENYIHFLYTKKIKSGIYRVLFKLLLHSSMYFESQLQIEVIQRVKEIMKSKGDHDVVMLEYGYVLYNLPQDVQDEFVKFWISEGKERKEIIEKIYYSSLLKNEKNQI